MQTVDMLNYYEQFIEKSTLSNVLLVCGRLGRIVRALRVFKLMRHSDGFRVLSFTIANSLRELFLLVSMRTVNADAQRTEQNIQYSVHATVSSMQNLELASSMQNLELAVKNNCYTVSTIN